MKNLNLDIIEYIEYMNTVPLTEYTWSYDGELMTLQNSTHEDNEWQ